jgi:hypothetical protein
VASPIRFWRTKSGLEVDFVLGEGEVALEVKGLTRVDGDLQGLKAFLQDIGRVAHTWLATSRRSA